MTVFLSILITLVIIFLIFFLMCFSMFKKTFSREKSVLKTEENFYKNLRKIKCEKLAETIRKNKKVFENIEGKNVSVLSRDEIHLTGKLYLTDDGSSEKSVILCHNRKSTGEVDFGAAFKMYREMNYNILIIDQRAHSGSGGSYTTMGIMESFDIIAWCKWLEMCFGTESEIVIHGVSMGAFSAVAAGANSEMPQNVKCIIAESLYPLIWSVIFKEAERNISFLAKPAVYFMNVFYKNHVGFDMRDFSLYTVAKSVKIPVLFIHSENDRTAPLSDIKSVVNRIPVKSRLVTVKKAPHGTCFAKEEHISSEAVKEFIGEL